MQLPSNFFMNSTKSVPKRGIRVSTEQKESGRVAGLTDGSLKDFVARFIGVFPKGLVAGDYFLLCLKRISFSLEERLL